MNQPSFAKRAFVLAYGVLAYLLFLGAFLYLIGFTMDCFVPRSVRSAAEAPFAQALMVNVSLIALFAVQHTIMARRGFKAFWNRVVSPAVERSTFVLTTVLCLVVMFWQWRSSSTVLWNVEGTWLGPGLTAVALAGWGTVLVSTFLIDHFHLFGLRQVWHYALGKPLVAPVFRERLFYRVVRHPLMVGFLVAFWATPVMTLGHAIFAATFTLYVFLAVRVEERTLVAEHGEAYEAYRARVRAFLPLPQPARARVTSRTS